jgi:hypothetical protein
VAETRFAHVSKLYGNDVTAVRDRPDEDEFTLADLQVERLAVGIRPEDVREAAGWDGARLQGHILLVESLGSEQLVHIGITATAGVVG